MSRATPQPDINFLNDFLAAVGKKSLVNQEFNKRRLERIAEKIGNDDWVQGQIARASIEIYFNNYDLAESILENALKITDNKSMQVWDVYFNLYVMIGDVNKALKLIKEIGQTNIPYSKMLKDTFLHTVNVYKLIELLEVYINLYPNKSRDYELMKKEIDQIEKLNVSLTTFRIFISSVYNEFYNKFTGTLSPEVIVEEGEIVVRVGCTIDKALDLFELNNSYRDKIMEIYSKISEQQREEFDKITVYFKHKNFENELGEVI